MSNLNDLNKYLFETIERLNKKELSGEKLKEEIDRASAIGSTACQIINNYALQLKAESMRSALALEKPRQSSELIVPIEDLNKPRVQRDKDFYKR